MLGHLGDIFFTILIALLSITVIPSIFEYIQVLLKFFSLLRIYRQPLGCLNLIYIVSPICKSGFKDLDFLILNGKAITKLLKTIIFMDKIDNTI